MQPQVSASGLSDIPERRDSEPNAGALGRGASADRSHSCDEPPTRIGLRLRVSLDRRRRDSLDTPSATAVDIAVLEQMRRSLSEQRQQQQRSLVRHSAAAAFGALRPLSPVDSSRSLHRPFTLSDDAVWRGVDLQDRGAFAIGSGTGMRATDHLAADHVHQALATYGEASEHRRSLLPMAKLLPTFLGKVAITLGADMLTLGASRHQTHLVAAGAVVLAAGIGSVAAGIGWLMQDMRLINHSRIRMTLLFTWVGVSLSAIGITVGECDLGAQNLGLRSGMAIIFGIGLTMMNYSLPLSFAYSEIVHGDIFRANRTEASFAMLGLGLAAATGLTVSRGAPDDEVKPKLFPFGVAHACAGVGIAGVTMATCLVATNLQRMHGRLLALRARLRHVARAAEA